MAEKVKPRIVAAVGASSTVGTAGSGGEPGPSPASQIQDAMNAAIVKCSEKGINDPVKVKAAMMDAREQVKKDWAAAEVAARKAAEVPPPAKGK